MPYDITRCCGQDCSLQETCLRCTAFVYGRQDFFTHLPYNFASSDCDYYLDDRPTEEAIRQRAYQLWEKNACQQNNDVANWLDAQKQLIDNLRNS
jgi:hypothetical protein